ncbi:MAG TPA: hypothetical protein VGK50_03760 [Coriobacteriia bacterium]|jgi:hypothetical protein
MPEMTGDSIASATVDDSRVRRAIFWAAVFTALTAAVSFGVAVTTPPRTGPFAAPATALVYPYANAVQFVPRDFLWMYPALLMMLAFLALAVCLHESALDRSRLPGAVGASLAAVSFGVISVDYFIQLQTVQPALLKGEAAGVAALSQYNPHGVFITLENLGFLVMALSFAFIAVSLGPSGLERAARWVLLAAAAAAGVAFVGMSLVFGFDLEYRFEVAIITIDWFTLMVSGVLIALAYAPPRAR